MKANLRATKCLVNQKLGWSFNLWFPSWRILKQALIFFYKSFENLLLYRISLPFSKICFEHAYTLKHEDNWPSTIELVSLGLCWQFIYWTTHSMLVKRAEFILIIFKPMKFTSRLFSQFSYCCRLCILIIILSLATCTDYEETFDNNNNELTIWINNIYHHSQLKTTDGCWEPKETYFVVLSYIWSLLKYYSSCRLHLFVRMYSSFHQGDIKDCQSLQHAKQ